MEVISNTIATVWDNGTRKNTGHSGKIMKKSVEILRYVVYLIIMRNQHGIMSYC